MNTSIEQADYFDVHTTVDAGKERDLPDYPGIEMGNKGLGDAYVSSPGPQFTPAGDADVPTAVHVRSDDKGQYIMWWHV